MSDIDNSTWREWSEGDGQWTLTVDAGKFVYAGEEDPEEESYTATLTCNEGDWSVTCEHASRGSTEEDSLSATDLSSAQKEAEEILRGFIRNWQEKAIDDGGEWA